MNKEDVLIFGLMLEANVLEDGLTEEDFNLYRNASLKVYGLTEESSEEDFEKAEKIQKEDIAKLVSSFRDKLKKHA